MESGTGKYDCFPCILLLKRKGGPSEEGSPLPTPRKKKKKSIKQLLVFVLISRGLILLLYGYAYDMTVDHAIGAYICTFCLFDYPIS